MYIASLTSVVAVTLAERPAGSPVKYVGTPAPVDTLEGVPLWKPPYGRITAIDLNTGDHRWLVCQRQAAPAVLAPAGPEGQQCAGLERRVHWTLASGGERGVHGDAG